MRRFNIPFGVVVLFLIILAPACAPRSEPVISEGPPLAPTSEETAEPAVTEEPTEPAITDESAEPQFPEFDPNHFDSPTSTVIDNTWMPMKPGTFWAYEGTALDGGETVNRRIEFTVTDLTKEIDGVRTVVAWIEDFNNDELIEKEVAFYAQDKEGTVWYFGEHPEDFEGGNFIEAPTWIAGLADAKPGIKMLPDPQLGGPILYQGWGPQVEWSDYGQVDQVGQQTCVPVDCYENVLVIAESSLGEEGAYQLKSYAQNIGNVEVGWKGTDETQEELKLVEYKELSPEELAAVHAQALELEKHAYEVSKDVYGETSPME
jgi:hypothetical protein